jgi:hypothetical protein
MVPSVAKFQPFGPVGNVYPFLYTFNDAFLPKDPKVCVRAPLRESEPIVVAPKYLPSSQTKQAVSEVKSSAERTVCGRHPPLLQFGNNGGLDTGSCPLEG